MPLGSTDIVPASTGALTGVQVATGASSAEAGKAVILDQRYGTPSATSGFDVALPAVSSVHAGTLLPVRLIRAYPGTVCRLVAEAGDTVDGGATANIGDGVSDPWHVYVADGEHAWMRLNLATNTYPAPGVSSSWIAYTIGNNGAAAWAFNGDAEVVAFAGYFRAFGSLGLVLDGVVYHTPQDEPAAPAIGSVEWDDAITGERRIKFFNGVTRTIASPWSP